MEHFSKCVGHRPVLGNLWAVARSLCNETGPRLQAQEGAAATPPLWLAPGLWVTRPLATHNTPVGSLARSAENFLQKPSGWQVLEK